MSEGMHEVTEVTYQPVLGRDMRERYKVRVSIVGLLDHKTLRKFKSRLWGRKLLDPTQWHAALDRDNGMTHLSLMILPQDEDWIMPVELGIRPYSEIRVVKLAVFPEDFWSVGAWQELLGNA